MSKVAKPREPQRLGREQHGCGRILPACGQLGRVWSAGRRAQGVTAAGTAFCDVPATALSMRGNSGHQSMGRAMPGQRQRILWPAGSG
jgi:hypothetical protein